MKSFAVLSIVYFLVLSARVDSRECVFEDSASGLSVDLSTLGRRDYLVSLTQDFVLALNPCKYLTSIQGGSSVCGSSFACLLNSQTQAPLSPLARKLGGWKFDDESITLTLEGDSCSEKRNQKVIISFECNNDEDSIGSPNFLSGDECTTRLIWKSSAACPVDLSEQSDDFDIDDKSILQVPKEKDEDDDDEDVKKVKGKNKDKNNEDDFKCKKKRDQVNSNIVYDLNPLSSPVDYYFINANRPAISYTLNVCRPIVGIGPDCSGKTGICENRRVSDTKVGDFNTQFTVTSPGNLLMSYPNGTGCNSGKVNFICDPSAGVGRPAYIALSEDNCDFLFEWRTAHACGYEKPAPCRFNFNGKNYDLRDLAGIYQTIGKDGRLYTISPCKKLKEDEAPFFDKGFGFQTQNSTMDYNMGFKLEGFSGNSNRVVVHYNGGDFCPNRVKRRFSIVYKCGPTLGAPVFKKEVNCRYVFKWKTNLVC